MTVLSLESKKSHKMLCRNVTTPTFSFQQRLTWKSCQLKAAVHKLLEIILQFLDSCGVAVLRSAFLLFKTLMICMQSLDRLSWLCTLIIASFTCVIFLCTSHCLKSTPTINATLQSHLHCFRIHCGVQRQHYRNWLNV